MKKLTKIFLPVLCALTLLVSMAAPALAYFRESLPWLEETTLVNQILERDGLIDGVWYPWFRDENLGHSLTTNEVMTKYHGLQRDYATVGIDTYGADKIYREIYNLKALGYNMLAYGGSIYGEGVIYDEYGDVLGIKQQYIDNVRRLLNMCRDIGMPVMWTICFHSSSCPMYWSNQAWNMITQMYCNPTVTEHYAERFVKPLCEVLAEYPDVVALIALTDEENNDTNDSELGNNFASREHWGVTQHDMQNFLYVINEAVKEKAPKIPRTIASSSDNSAMFEALDLDLIGSNRYANNAGAPTTESYHTSAPMLLTEYNVGGELKVNEDTFFGLQKNFREAMMKYGYAGGFQWCWMPDCAGGGQDMLTAKYQTTKFRGAQYMIYHYMEEYRAEYRGETLVLDTPSLLANDGSGKVEWIASRQATAMDLLRSTDGGKTWEKLLDNVDPSKYVDADGKGTYTDTTHPKSGFKYKVVVRDAAGNEVESAPNNEPEQATQFPASDAENTTVAAGSAPYQTLTKDQAKLSSFGMVTNRPVCEAANLIKNSSFEEEVSGQWNNRSFLSSEVQVVTDETAPDGEKVLYFNTSKNSEAGWHTFTVYVEPNTEYILSAWLKGAFIGPDNLAGASFGVVDPDQKEMGYMIYWEYYRGYSRASRTTQQLFPNAWDEEWHLRSVSFNSGKTEQVTLALYGASSQMWMDSIALYKLTDGIKYVGENLRGSADYFMSEQNSCAPENSATQNVNLDDTASDYWQTGSGWQNGFMSIADTGEAYGSALKYTASSTPVGIYYTKWVDVKPYTDYVFAADVKILESGSGFLTVMEDKISGPINILEFDFDADTYGEEWFPFCTAFNSSAYTRIGIAVCDKGGEAYIDNIRLFEEQYGDGYEDVLTGWVEDEYNGGWMYYENHYKVTSKWIKYDGGWYYLDEDGYRVDNQWKKDSNGWCYLDANGRMATNKWIKDSKGWCYVGQNGYCVTNTWKKDSKGWCYLDANGRMATNQWVKDSVGWCYVGANGYAVTNTWKKDSKGWCYLNSSGSMTKNAWVNDGTGWYFLDKDGYMVSNQWKKDSKGWCYLTKSGKMATNQWIKDSKGWCYVGKNGYCLTSQWVKDSKGWCFLDENGRMVYSKWIKGGGKYYYIDQNGYMIAGKTVTIDGKKYTFNAAGVWVA